MADNVTLDPGAGGAVMKTDDDGTAHWPYAKIAFGADNTQTRVTSTVGMPVKVLSGTLELGKVEDTAHSTGDVGVMMLAVRNDTLAALVGADGDYSALQVNGDGALYVRSAGHASTDNSSATPLGISGVFTGTAEDITHYSSVSVSVFADVASASGGLSLQFSTDGTNWDNTEGHDVAAGVHHFVGGMGESKWFRVVYTNGTTAQTAFRLQTMLRNSPLSGEIEPIDHTLEGGEDAQLVRAIIAAQKPDTTYANIQATAGGNLKIAIEDVDTGASGLAKVEDSAHTTGDVGVMSLAVRKDTAGTLAGTDGDYSPFQVDADGNLRVVGMAGPSGGSAPYKNIDVDESEDQVKGTAGQIYWIHAINLSSAVKYLKVYNATAAAVTVGTTVPDLTFPIPTQGDSNGAGFVLTIAGGIELDTAITVAATTGVADNDSGAPGANEVIVNMGYA